VGSKNKSPSFFFNVIQVLHIVLTPNGFWSLQPHLFCVGFSPSECKRMTQSACDVRCKRYMMVVREFRRLRGETWDASFSARLGKAASKLYREIYGKPPTLRRSKRAHRNFVTRFPCGIIEQAYQQLVARGIPLVGNVTPKALWRERVRQLEEERARANGPTANVDAIATGDET
jgi:hypothetical protein